jgi:hypothetical protein
VSFCGIEHNWGIKFLTLDKELKAGIALLRKVGNGDPVDGDGYMATIKFLSEINAWALYHHEEARRGCF